jgi:putative FmdB family regulatory protein
MRMPIYEYDCPRCGRFEVIQKLSARPLRTHDTCGSKVTKLMSAGAFSVKGPGSHQAAPACPNRSPDAPGCAGCPSAQA